MIRYISKVKSMDWLSRLSYSTIFVIWLANAALVAIVYLLLSYVPGHGPIGINGHWIDRAWSSLYLSVVTATTVGYGDILPVGFSRLFAAGEAIVGFFLFALFVSKFMGHRQEIAIREVHKLAFEDRFHNLREDMHTVRQDLDRLTRKVHAKEELSADDWEQLEIAYAQIASLINEIPRFYDDENRLYILDAKRERFLLEAMSRTLTRVYDLLLAMDQEGVRWDKEEGNVAALSELHDVLNTCLSVWRQRSPHGKLAEFTEIMATGERVRGIICDTMNL